jgi:hypothetical protein
MIGEVTTSRSLASALSYAMRIKEEDKKLSKKEVEKKFPEVTPTPHDPGWNAGARHRVIGGNMSGEIELELKREFSAVRRLRPDIKKPLLSISVRKAPNDTVSLQAWEEIAECTIEGLGLKGCPFLVVQHRDKDAHIHILASRIRLDGKVISDSKNYEKVERVMRQVEIKYGFERVQASCEIYDRAPTWWEHKLAHDKGRLSPKLEMQARISAVLEDKPTTTQFITRLHETHNIDAIFRLDEDKVPSGIAFRYGEAVMSGGALGRGYTWKKLLERGLTYDRRDIEAIERAGEGARPHKQPITDRERTVSRTTRTISNAGGIEINDRSIGGAVRETVTECDGRDIQSQQYATRPGASRRDQSSDQARLPEAEANRGVGEDSTIRYEAAESYSILDGLTTPQTGTGAINPDANLFTNTFDFARGYNYMGLPTTVAGGNPGNELLGATGLERALGNDIASDLGDTGANVLDGLAPSEPSTVLDGFRDGLRETIREVDDYMQDYCQEDVQSQTSIMVDPVELIETGVEAEAEIQAVLEELMIL